MSQPPPGSWPPPSGGGPPPQPPPPGGGKRNLVIAIVAVVVVAAAAIIAIIALSGGDSKPAAQPSATLTGSPVRPSSTVAPSTVASTAPPTSTGSAPSCADIAGSSLLNGKITLNPGGAKPTGVPLPAGTPSLICRGATRVNEAAHVTALAWPGVSQASYLGQLTRAGWADNTATPPFHVLGKQGAKFQIVTFEIKGSLVAIFGPA